MAASLGFPTEDKQAYELPYHVSSPPCGAS